MIDQGKTKEAQMFQLTIFMDDQSRVRYQVMNNGLTSVELLGHLSHVSLELHENARQQRTAQEIAQTVKAGSDQHAEADDDDAAAADAADAADAAAEDKPVADQAGA